MCFGRLILGQPTRLISLVDIVRGTPKKIKDCTECEDQMRNGKVLGGIIDARGTIITNHLLPPPALPLPSITQPSHSYTLYYRQEGERHSWVNPHANRYIILKKPRIGPID